MDGMAPSIACRYLSHITNGLFRKMWWKMLMNFGMTIWLHLSAVCAALVIFQYAKRKWAQMNSTWKKLFSIYRKRKDIFNAVFGQFAKRTKSGAKRYFVWFIRAFNIWRVKSDGVADMHQQFEFEAETKAIQQPKTKNILKNRKKETKGDPCILGWLTVRYAGIVFSHSMSNWHRRFNWIFFFSGFTHTHFLVSFARFTCVRACIYK